MSDRTDPLEAELAALRPIEPSPELRLRIAGRLADSYRINRRTAWEIAATGGLAAACLLAAATRWGFTPGPEPGPITVQQTTVPKPTVVVKNSEPTLFAYHHALAQSPAEFELLLNRVALTAPVSHPELARVGLFTRSDAALHALLGED
jgi:hypothetical protein